MAGPTDLPRPPPAGSARWYAWLFTPSHAQAITARLFALESELRSIVDVRLDHGIAHLKLHWWRDEIDRLVHGEPRHPLTQGLAAAAPQAVPWSPLGDFLTSLQLELAQVAIDDEAELERFLALADGLQRSMAIALRGEVPQATAVAIGSAIGQAVRGAQISADWRAAPIDGQRHGAVVRLAARSRACWEKGSAMMAQPGAEDLRGLRVLGRLHMALLDRIDFAQLEPASPDHTLPAMRSLWTAWRAARQH